VQGGKLKAKKEIRISALFRRVPEPFLTMIVVHELAHLREKDHNKAFYQLCCYMEPDYHQLEFDLRLYLSHRDRYGDLWQEPDESLQASGPLLAILPTISTIPAAEFIAAAAVPERLI